LVDGGIAVPINELRAIETSAKAVEVGSLRKAAAAQGSSPQAVSQALSQLEQHLGVRLLHRTTRSIALTEEGQQFLEAARPALTMLERALQRVRAAKDEIVGPLPLPPTAAGGSPRNPLSKGSRHAEVGSSGLVEQADCRPFRPDGGFGNVVLAPSLWKAGCQ